MAAESSTATGGRSGGGVTAESYIGSLISLTSKSEIRYEGVLYNINTEESSIGLRNVRSFGTEGRKKDGSQVPSSDKIYEYILFRGSDIKDLHVKASPPVQSSPPINSDPAIIQSHYPRPTGPLPPAAAPSESLGHQGAHSAQMGLPGSTFQSGLGFYPPGGNLNSWAPPLANANAGGLGMPPMYWPGFYNTPNALPQMSQQTLLRPPHGLSVPPSMQQMQFSGFSSSLPATAQGTSSSTLASTSPPSTSTFNVPALQPGSLESGTMINQLQSKPPVSALPASTPVSSLPSSVPLSTTVLDNAGVPASSSNLGQFPDPTGLSQQKISEVGTSISGPVSSVHKEKFTPSLVTPGQLLQPGPATVSSSQPLPAIHKDVEVVQQVSPKRSTQQPSAPAAIEAQPAILPLPQGSRGHKPDGTRYHMRSNYRGRGGRGFGVSRPVTKFTEDFDFTAMNEKFNKDEVWGNLGKTSQAKDKEGEENASDGEYSREEDATEQPEIEAKQPVYNKDDFFDSLSCTALDTNPNHGRTRYSEQVKLDTETFGDFSSYRGGRGYNRGGGGRFRGSYHGRGYGGGYGYGNRGRGGRAMQNRT